jgi:hypothetical protein
MMRQLASWWQQVLPRLPDEPDESFPPNRLGLSLVSAAAAFLNVGDYEQARRCMIRSDSVGGLSPSGAGLQGFMKTALEEMVGVPPADIIRLAEWATPLAAEQAVAVGCTRAQWLLLAGATDQCVLLLDELLTRYEGEDDTSWVALGHALRGLAAVVSGSSDSGLDQLHAVLRDTGSTEVNWLYPRINWVHGLGHLLAGHTDETLVAAHSTLVASRDWGIYWGLPYAVELAGLTVDQVGDHALAARALGSLDTAYRNAGGKSPSAYPDTILHPYRQMVETRPQAAEEHLRGSRIRLTDIVAQLIRHLQHLNEHRDRTRVAARNE